jgi:hypothetical protein
MSNSTTQRQEQAMNDEVLQMITAGIHYGLIPENISEIEFNVNGVTGQASSLEYWPSIERKAEERKEVKIPASLMKRFQFIVTAKFLQRGRGK